MSALHEAEADGAAPRVPAGDLPLSGKSLLAPRSTRSPLSHISADNTGAASAARQRGRWRDVLRGQPPDGAVLLLFPALPGGLACSAHAVEVTGARKRKLDEVADGAASEDVEVGPGRKGVSTPPIGGRGQDLGEASDGACGEGAPTADMEAEDGGDPRDIVFEEGADLEGDEPASELSEEAAAAACPEDPDEPRIQMIAPRPSGPAGAAGQQAGTHPRPAAPRRSPQDPAPRPGPLSTLSRLTQAGVLALGETLRYESEGGGEVISGA